MNLNRNTMTAEEKLIYREGFKAGVRLFAVWKNGREVVGIREETYMEFIKEVDEGNYDPQI